MVNLTLRKPVGYTVKNSLEAAVKLLGVLIEPTKNIR